jgi:hypothetical protein
MQFKFAPSGLDDYSCSKWHKQFALLPQRVETKLIWWETFYIRFVPVRDYNSYISKTSENQWTYKWDIEYRLKENMTEEDFQNAY